MTIDVPLTNGGHALIDAADAHLIAGRSWYSVRSRGTLYAKSGKNTRMHRVLLDAGPHQIVDHINGNGLDNRRANLRLVTVAENVGNRQRSRGANRFPGVYLEDGKWSARVTHNYRRKRLGNFDTELLALEALNAYRVSIGRPPVGRSE